MTPITIKDSEAQMRAAIVSGDPEQIAAAAALVDQLDRPKPSASLHQAALWYAGLAVPVFPLRAGTKAPMGSCLECRDGKCPGPQECGHDLCHGLKDATTDIARINQWWGHDPRRNIGIATGHVFDAVDIDGPDGQQSRATHWQDVFADIDRDCLAKVLTPRPGGMHIYVPPTGDGNSTEIVPKVDYRGLGGYVVAPPSVIEPGGKDSPGTYRFLGEPRLSGSVLGEVA
jgi:hypothetical protein